MKLFVVLVPLAILAVVSPFCGMAESGERLMAVLRKTFAPMTAREFWFPPCPLCWGARAFALVAIAAIILSIGEIQ